MDNLQWSNVPWLTPGSSYELTLSVMGSQIMGRVSDPFNPNNVATYMVNDTTNGGGAP